MNTADLLVDAFGRVRERVHRVVNDLSSEELTARVEGANSIAWLVWHLTRIQDDHVAAVARHEQTWTAGGWIDRFGLPFDRRDTGYGHDDAEVGAVRVDAGALLVDYYDAVHDETIAFVRDVTDDDLDVVVDESWDPPVTLGVRLISVINDNLQHVGQAAFVRGILRP